MTRIWMGIALGLVLGLASAGCGPSKTEMIAAKQAEVSQAMQQVEFEQKERDRTSSAIDGLPHNPEVPTGLGPEWDTYRAAEKQLANAKTRLVSLRTELQALQSN